MDRNNSAFAPESKQVDNEMNARELVNQVRTDIGALIDADRSNANALSALQKSDAVAPHDHAHGCCCNFLHYSLRRVMRDAEQMKQFALNTAMIGLDPSKLRDPTNTLCPAICIPMANCENIGDQRFPSGPTWTTISKNGTQDAQTETKTRSMVIQSINTDRGPIQMKLDPQSFGLAPFFSDQYETFIKGPPTSIFLTSYIHAHANPQTEPSK